MRGRGTWRTRPRPSVDRGVGGHHLSRRRASATATMVAAKSITAARRLETGTAHQPKPEIAGRVSSAACSRLTGNGSIR